MVQRSSASGFDHHSSLSRRSELPPDDDDDTRDLGELILALKGDQSCHDIFIFIFISFDDSRIVDPLKSYPVECQW